MRPTATERRNYRHNKPLRSTWAIHRQNYNNLIITVIIITITTWRRRREHRRCGTAEQTGELLPGFFLITFYCNSSSVNRFLWCCLFAGTKSGRVRPRATPTKTPSGFGALCIPEGSARRRAHLGCSCAALLWKITSVSPSDLIMLFVKAENWTWEPEEMTPRWPLLALSLSLSLFLNVARLTFPYKLHFRTKQKAI